MTPPNLSPWLKSQIASALIQGETTSALAERLGLPRKDIEYVKLHELAVPPSQVSGFFTGTRKREVFPGWKLELALRMYDQGTSLADIARTLGVDPPNLRWRLRQHGRIGKSGRITGIREGSRKQ
jgi:hypothetical protein